MSRMIYCFILLLSACSTLVKVPEVPMTEANTSADEAWKFVLSQFVDTQGRVDFKRLSKNPQKLLVFVNYIAKESPKSNPDKFPTKQAQLAYYLNSYNALSMYNILDAGIPDSLAGLKKVKFFYFKKFVIGGETMSLYAYENDVIRALGDERVHVALNCMSAGCPRLPQYPFPSTLLDAELEKQAKLFFNEPRNVQVDEANRVVRVSEILNFFTDDFLKKSSSLIGYVNRYHKNKIPEDFSVEFIPYDWTVNAQPEAPSSRMTR